MGIFNVITRDEILMEYNSGKTKKQIADAHFVDVHTINNILNGTAETLDQSKRASARPKCPHEGTCEWKGPQMYCCLPNCFKDNNIGTGKIHKDYMNSSRRGKEGTR